MDVRVERAGDDGGEHGDEPGLDASGSITPDPFLAEVARIPSRAVPVADPPLRAGETIGRFVIGRELGRGGMGIVYAAEDATLGRTVALKVLPFSEDEGRRRRFLREARAAAGLNHPGIATIHEIGESAGRVFIAMELVHGETLRARLAGGALSVADALPLARDISRALARAHERGVVHRDLKPENVMLSDDGHIKLLDFGLAKPIAAGDLATATTATEHGRLLGTPTYMSPEQAKGREVDARSDVFSLGVMLYEMLTGQRPFSGGTVVELFIALDRDEPAPPSRVARRIPAALERVVMRCLRKDPAQRYADAGAVLRELAPLTAPTRSPRPWLGLAAAAVGALALTAVILVVAVAPPATKPAPAVVPTTLTDLPMPKGARPEVVAAYRDGLRRMREGNVGVQGLVRAVELDPELAAAHAQLATVAMGHSTEQARDHFRKAQALRDRLDPRDQVMLDALEPLVQRQPADWAEANRRFAAAVERFPGDAELWHLLGLGRANYDDFEAAVADQRRALTLDPGFAEAHSTLAMDLAYLGRFDESLEALDRCLAVSPASLGCMKLAAQLRSERGECDAVEAVSRRMIAAGAPAFASYCSLADALAARGASNTSVREAVRQAEQGLADLPAGWFPETSRKQTKLVLHAAIAALEGDFEAALRLANEYAPTLEGNGQQSERGAFARWLAQLYLETGRDADAARVAMDFLDRRDAWEPAPSAEDVAMAGDATASMLLAAVRGGAMTRADFVAKREAFRRSWTERMTPVTRNFLWVHGYAAMVDGPEDAREAMAALARYQPVPPFRPESRVDAEVGRAFLLAGRPDDAIAWLERSTRRCEVLRRPIEYVHALLVLGDARVEKGDTTGACAAYSEVLARWGNARPRSVTAERARAEHRALGCGVCD